MLGDEEEARVGVQEVFLRFMRRQPWLRDSGKYPNYLFRPATNYCIGRLREMKRLPATREVDGHTAGNAATPEENVSRKQLVEECLGRLDGRQRLVAYLHFGEGMTQEEVALATELSRSTVGRILRRFSTTMRDEGLPGGEES